MRRAWSTTPFVVALGGLALVALGCPPSDYGKKCRFTGDDQTTCGSCIARNCQPYVDQCCASTYSCAAELSVLDECASTGACSKLAAKIATTSSASREMRGIAQCAQASCSTACGGLGSGTTTIPKTSRVSCGTSVGSCTCDVVGYPTTGSEASDRCPSTAMSGGTTSKIVCCATSDGWPDDPDGSCTCTTYTATAPNCRSTEFRVSYCR